jgi:hypothetical protein
MKAQWLFCSACDRPVRALVLEAMPDGEIQDAHVVCLEIGPHCTGNMCPLDADKPMSGVGPVPFEE